ncbi:acetyl-CoA synthetase-like protein [Cubamyces sp. BRFM 1775]|nr:acetyl-CoA synthetase-like protein [Cubamyces sp. BRFM 1775]
MPTLIRTTTPVTLTSLLSARSLESGAGAHFLDLNGRVTKTLSYADLYRTALADSRRLRSLVTGLDPAVDVIVASLSNNDLHVRLFWACCFAGIPVCPIPPLHPDTSRRTSFLVHLQSMFCNPIVITDDPETTATVQALEPAFQTLSWATVFGPSASVTCVDEDALSDGGPREALVSDVVCMMLTSGSTGKPKAVALRHSNIISGINGKIEHHGTTSSSRFLNWIHFDHVACITEVHLHALAANANQYHISPSAIVQRPRLLLELCSTYRISYTFSPNFLIAQICRELSPDTLPSDAFDLSGLVAFISGGEAVSVKTAIAFANLLEAFGAPRNALRAGFGMSETCAGCIYDTRPCVRDDQSTGESYLSLGLCCPGVELRVVSRETQTPCRPLEPGRLQLRGPTVFSEYYNDPKATSESFTADGWFITGDNAMLDEEGRLHLVGREKDQININGVKYSNVDLEYYISEGGICGLTRSLVFVCPMRVHGSDTETYAVFYRHSEVDVPVDGVLGDEDAQLVKETSYAIRDRCVFYCLRGPHVVLPLPSTLFTKTAIGKVSRASLLAAYMSGKFQDLEQRTWLSVPSSHPQNLTGIEETVSRVIAEVMGVDGSWWTRTTNIFELGMSSMHIVRLKHALQEEFKIEDIPVIDLLRRAELRELCDYLTSVQSSPSASTYNPVVTLRAHGSKPPLFLVHPGVGEVLVFLGLAKVLEDRPVYALRARGFEDGDDVFSSFGEMVDVYVGAVEKAQPTGAYHIAGYSFGGAVAFEMGRALESKGKRVAWVGVFNLPPFIQARMHELTWIEVLLNLFMFVGLVTPTAVGRVRELLSDAFPAAADLDVEPGHSALLVDWLLVHSDQARLQKLQLRPAQLLRWAHVAYALTQLGRSYLPTGTLRDASLTVFCAAPLPSMGTREVYKAKQLSPWGGFCERGVDFIDVEGEHYTMLSEAHVQPFASKLVDAIEKNSQPPQSVPITRKDFGSIPIVDFSLATSNSSKYHDQLRDALEDVGFVLFVNVPGFEDAFQRKVFAAAEELFNKPDSWKDSLSASSSYALRGHFRGDDIAGPHKAYAEAYRFGLDSPAPVGDNVPFWKRLHQGPNQWPAEEDLPKFRSLMETLFERYRALNLALNEHICQLLDIPQAALDAYFPDEHEFNSAIWHYLPVNSTIRAGAQNGFAQGMHEHRDPSTFVTCLIQSRPGLQVQNHAGAWIDVPYVEGGVSRRAGMQLMRLTGGKLVATTHRVNTLLIDEDRYTIPYVLSTKLDKPVVPLPQFSSADVAKEHIAPNPKVLRLASISDPLERSGYARLTLFPAIAKKLYPNEFQRAEELGLM